MTTTGALIVLGAVPLFGQDPPAAPDPPQEEDELGWRGSLDLGGSLTRGNSEVTSLSTGVDIVRVGDRDRWTGSASALRQTVEGEETANRLQSTLQYDFFAAERTFVFGRAAGLSNRPAGTRARLTVGAGGGHDVLRRERLEVSVLGGATHIAEEFVDRSTDQHFNVLAAQRLELELAEETRVRQSLQIQPRVDDFGDFLMEAEGVLDTRLVGDLGLRLSVAADYDSSPFQDPDEPEPRERLDTTITTSVTYQF